jgi:hypothetical protein
VALGKEAKVKGPFHDIHEYLFLGSIPHAMVIKMNRIGTLPLSASLTEF